jgi:hypothetical protein
MSCFEDHRLCKKNCPNNSLPHVTWDGSKPPTIAQQSLEFTTGCGQRLKQLVVGEDPDYPDFGC